MTLSTNVEMIILTILRMVITKNSHKIGFILVKASNHKTILILSLNVLGIPSIADSIFRQTSNYLLNTSRRRVQNYCHRKV
jgi:hypothetical protein